LERVYYISGDEQITISPINDARILLREEHFDDILSALNFTEQLQYTLVYADIWESDKYLRDSLCNEEIFPSNFV